MGERTNAALKSMNEPVNILPAYMSALLSVPYAATSMADPARNGTALNIIVHLLPILETMNPRKAISHILA